MEKEQFLSSVYIILKDENDNVLLQRRCGTKLWCGFLAFPAGHIDQGENAYEAVIREAKEELDITLDLKDIIDTFVVNRKNKTLQPYYDVYFIFEKYAGTIKINEPGRCSELIWININNLPTDMIEFEKVALKNYQNGIHFSVIDVDNK